MESSCTIDAVDVNFTRIEGTAKVKYLQSKCSRVDCRTPSRDKDLGAEAPDLSNSKTYSLAEVLFDAHKIILQ